MSLGFEQAGFDVVAAVEYDPIHAAAHMFNFPDCTVIPRSIDMIEGREIRLRSGIGSRQVDVVFGGSPCQGFSLIGQRMLDDPRNGLVREFVRIVRELDASYFVFENVKGLTLGKHRRFLDEVIEEFGANGYEVRDPWRVLNAVCYGTPQTRERLILLGARKGLRLPEYPPPFVIQAGYEPGLLKLPTGPNCKEAIGDLPNAEAFASLERQDWVRTDRWGQPSEFAAEMRCIHDEAWHFGYRRRWDPAILTSSGRSTHSEVSRKRFAGTPCGEVEPISRFYKLPPFGVANTLRAGSDSKRGAFTSPRPIHYQYPRCITVREMARLHGFPDWFRFHVTKWHGARQVGNAVPPPLARAIAFQLIKAGGFHQMKPKVQVELGATALLEMDMTRASEYWKVPDPIGKRDKKSGNRKQRQGDVRIRVEKQLSHV